MLLANKMDRAPTHRTLDVFRRSKSRATAKFDCYLHSAELCLSPISITKGIVGVDPLVNTLAVPREVKLVKLNGEHGEG